MDDNNDSSSESASWPVSETSQHKSSKNQLTTNELPLQLKNDEKTKQNVSAVNDSNNFSEFQNLFNPCNNRVAIWRTNRNQIETETERNIRLQRERELKAMQRMHRDQLESIQERVARLERETNAKNNSRHQETINETTEMHATKLKNQAQRKTTLRNVLTLQETEDEHDNRLNSEAATVRSRRHDRELIETEEMRDIRLRHEADKKTSERHSQIEQETEQERNTRLDSEAISRRTRRQLALLQETEEQRNIRLNNESLTVANRRLTRDLMESEEMREMRLRHEADKKTSVRHSQIEQETEQERNTRLNSGAISQRTRRQLALLQETEEQRNIRLNNESLTVANRRRNKNIQENDALRSARLKKQAASKSNKRSTTEQLETDEQRNERLLSNNQAEKIRRNKRQQNESEQEENHRKLRKRNADLSRNTNITQRATQSWPQIPMTEIKHACLTNFKNSMSNHAVHQVVCASCACLHYKTDTVQQNIAKIPNKHLLYHVDYIPSCILRLNLDIDTITNTFQISEEQIQEYFSDAENTTVIINKMLLCRKGIHLNTGNVQLCNKCHEDLSSNKLPALSLSNLMWIGDVPQELRDLTLPEQKLIALYRHSSCVIKLCGITGDPSLAQSALKGNVITFPQNLSDIVKHLPLSPNELPDIIKIIFVGKTIPSKDQVRSILTIRQERIRTALIWLHTNNILYKDIHIDHLLLDAFPLNDIPDCLWNTMSFLKDTETSDVERSGYVDNDINPDELCLNGVVPLNMSALIDTRLYPTLFPYGLGGVENERRSVRVSYAKHIRYFLSYHDHRFEMNTSFIFVTFNILQRRTACAKSRILASRPFFSSQATEINQLTAKEVKIALDQIESNSSERTLNPRLSAFLKQLKTISGSVMGSNQSRANYRVELHAQIFFSGLPNIFITINPCDLHHPLAMKFAGVDLDIDNLTAELMP
ncbi:unnamed protein product, partial [Rotaria magnacalcarata]